MNAQDLKNSILQLAIQGKLVEQRAEEGTAKELLEQIKAEKEKLIKEKKIKKEKRNHSEHIKITCQNISILQNQKMVHQFFFLQFIEENLLVIS